MASTFSLTGRSPWGGGRDSPASITCWGKTISHRSISIHLSNHPSIHQSIHPSIRAASFDLGVQFKVPRLFSVEPRDPSIPLLAQATISFSMVMIPQDQDLWIGNEHYLMQVRHPFERLVSAYQSKVVRSTDEWYLHFFILNHFYFKLDLTFLGKSWRRYSWVRTRLKEQFGDASFTSFVKMIVAKGKKVSSWNFCYLSTLLSASSWLVQGSSHNICDIL